MAPNLVFYLWGPGVKSFTSHDSCVTESETFLSCAIIAPFATALPREDVS